MHAHSSLSFLLSYFDKCYCLNVLSLNNWILCYEIGLNVQGKRPTADVVAGGASIRTLIGVLLLGGWIVRRRHAISATTHEITAA